VSTATCFVFVKETYAPIILQRKATRIRKETGRAVKTKFDKGQTAGQVIKTAIARPTKLLTTSPIVIILSMYMSIVYSYMYLLFTTFTTVFEGRYGFNSGEAGLAYLGLGVGFCIGQFTVGRFSDWYTKRQKAIRGVAQPEDRLPPLLVGVCLLPVGLFWYGWSVNAHTHWMIPIVGTGFVGVGILYVFLPIQMYLIDTFTIYAASAIGANTVVRSVFGATIPLAGPALYNRLGMGWGNSLLGFIAIAFAPGALMLIKFGESIRTNPKFQPKL
jgi:MFS family permease